MTLRHVLAAALAVSLPAAAADPPSPPSSYTPVEFTISGGISLGNYEAGVNWSVVRLIKLHTRDPKALMDLPPPRLVAVSGASAGNVNALIAAIEWCRTDDQDVAPLKNSFYESWISVGWDGLFAGDRTCVQYCHDQKLDGKDGWASRVGGGGEEACVKACRADCQQSGGKDCEDGGPAYRSDDAIFTRRAFIGVEENFRRVIERGKYDPACKLAVGITTTKFHPTLLDVTGPPPEDTQKREEPPHYVPQPYSVGQSALTIATQRYVTSLRAETRQGHFGYYEHSFQDDHTLGTYLHLPKVPRSDNRVAVDDVLALTEASSAFPLAFGPRKLRFCRVAEKATPASSECVANELLTHDWFIDGGAFDNVPLGLGYSLTDAMVTRQESLSNERRQFFYIDPDRRRYVSSSGDSQMTAKDTAPVAVYPSLSEVLTLAGSFYAVAGKYELQTVARYVWREKPGQPEPKLLIAGRLTPIVGEYLYAFGAFLAEPFRRFDYEVGVYEGAYDYANWVCGQEQGKPGARSQPRCMFDQIKAAYADLRVARVDAADPYSAEPRYVFLALFDREFRTWAALADAPERPELEALAAEAEAWSRSEHFDLNAPPNPAIGALVRAVSTLHDQEVAAALEKPGAKEDVLKYQNDFAHFLQLLGKDALEGYSPEERELLADPQAFTNRAMLSALSRERQIEAEHNNEITTRALSAAQVVLLGAQSSKTLGLEVDPSSIPDDNLLTVGKVLARLLPYRVTGKYSASAGFNLGAGGWNRLEISYEPTLGLLSDWALIAPIGGYWQFSSGAFGAFATPGVLFRNHQVFFTGVDLGLRMSGDFAGPAGTDPGFHVGAELGARVLGGKIRLSAGVDNFGSPALVLGIGLVDFNGLLYWGVRIAEGK